MTSGAGPTALRVIDYDTGQPTAILANINIYNAVQDFGADPTGTVDSTKAIQKALNIDGAIVILPPGTYNISSTLVIGNGSASLASTINGIVLRGSIPSNGFTASENTPQLLWKGSVGGTMINIKGPIVGWGLENLYINCAGIAATGVQIVSANSGYARFLTINQATSFGIRTFCVATGGTGHQSVQVNDFANINIFMPATANAAGIFLDADNSTASNNTSLNTFSNISIGFPASSLTMFGLYLKGCDSNVFTNLTIEANNAANTGITGLVFDYGAAGASAEWPANNTFYLLDIVTPFGTQYANFNTPIGTVARPNRVYGISDTNAGTYPTLANTTYNPEIVNPPVALTGQTGSIGSTNLLPIVTYMNPQGLFRVNYYMTNTVAGSAGTVTLTLGWADINHTQSITSASLSLTGAGYVQDSVVMSVSDAEQITYSTTVAGAMGSPQYALYITIEKLG